MKTYNNLDFDCEEALENGYECNVHFNMGGTIMVATFGFNDSELYENYEEDEDAMIDLYNEFRKYLGDIVSILKYDGAKVEHEEGFIKTTIPAKKFEFKIKSEDDTDLVEAIGKFQKLCKNRSLYEIALPSVTRLYELEDLINSTGEETDIDWYKIYQIVKKNEWISCDGDDTDIAIDKENKEVLYFGQDKCEIAYLNDADLADYLKKYSDR